MQPAQHAPGNHYLFHGQLPTAVPQHHQPVRSHRHDLDPAVPIQIADRHIFDHAQLFIYASLFFKSTGKPISTANPRISLDVSGKTPYLKHFRNRK